MGKGLVKCDRCNGMMIYEKFFHDTEQFWAWRCVYCGEYMDQVIWENRQQQKLLREKSRMKNREPLYGSSGTPSGWWYSRRAGVTSWIRQTVFLSWHSTPFFV